MEDPDLSGILFLYLVLRIIEVGLIIAMTILWIRGMYRAIQACHPLSRSGDPGSAWLILIPIWGLIWQFIVSNRVSESLAREYHRRGWHSDEDRPGLELGIVAGVTVCLVLLVRCFFALPGGIAFVGTLAILTTMYRHMDRLNSYRERLEKEYDPSTAFGQIPVTPAMINYAQGNYVNPYLQENGRPLVYANPNFVNPVLPQNQEQPLVYANPNLPPVNTAPAPPANEASQWMPPTAKNETPEMPAKQEDPFAKPENQSDALKKWMPKEDPFNS